MAVASEANPYVESGRARFPPRGLNHQAALQRGRPEPLRQSGDVLHVRLSKGKSKAFIHNWRQGSIHWQHSEKNYPWQFEHSPNFIWSPKSIILSSLKLDEKSDQLPYLQFQYEILFCVQEEDDVRLRMYVDSLRSKFPNVDCQVRDSQRSRATLWSVH